MARLSKENIRYLLFEGVVVLFSVLLALMIDAWQEDRRGCQEVRENVQALNVEIRSSLEELQSFLGIVEGRHERLQPLEQRIDNSRSFASYTGDFGGYRVPDLDTSAWERMRQNPLMNRVDLEYLRDAFILYRWHDLMSGYDKQIIQMAYSELFFDPSRAFICYQITNSIMNEQMRVAQEMIDIYEDFLEKHAS